MQTCNDDPYKCPPICDFCQHFDFNGEERSGTVVYVYNGMCMKRNERSNPDDGCEDFACVNLKGVE